MDFIVCQGNQNMYLKINTSFLKIDFPKYKKKKSFFQLFILFKNKRNPNIWFILEDRYSVLQVVLVSILAE